MSDIAAANAEKNYRLHDLQSLQHVHVTADKIIVDDSVAPYEATIRKADTHESDKAAVEAETALMMEKGRMTKAAAHTFSAARDRINAKPWQAFSSLFALGLVYGLMRKQARRI